MKLSIFFSTVVMSLAFSCAYASADNLSAPVVAVEPEQALISKNLTADMFKTWTSAGGNVKVSGLKSQQQQVMLFVIGTFRL